MFLSLLTSLAQAEFDYSSSGEVPAGIVASLGIFMILIWIVIIAFGLFTLWMLIDSIMRSEEDYQAASSGSKIMWIILILFLGFIPAIVYFFLVRKKAKNATGQVATVSTPTPTPTPEAPKVEPEKKEEVSETPKEEKKEEEIPPKE